MSNNPFVPAAWGQTYDLAGAQWEVGSKINLLGPRPICFLNREVFIEDERGEMRHLFPSPDWINAQADPRAVAIAALVRAGATISQDQSPVFIWNDFTRIVVFGEADDDGVFSAVCMVEDDPSTASYIADCFEVLHAWAAAIKWEDTHDETA